jgi:hypothetical protein
MNICINCGVELDEDVIICPLCGQRTSDEKKTKTPDKSEYYPSDIIMLHKTETRRNLWELSGIIALSAIAVCSIVDLVLSRSLTWSLYVATSVLAAWICLSLILLAFRKYFIVIPGLLLTILTMLFIFDLVSPPVNWFFGIGLPVTISFFISVSIITLLWKLAHFKGFNILAIAFIVLSGFCIVTEIFINNYLFKHISIRWSAIVAAAIFPIASVLLFIHYRMKKGKSLGSFFHV